MQIKTEELKEILSLLIDKLTSLESSTINLEKELYWNITDKELYNVYQEPIEMTIGSIKDDWEFSQKILIQEREVINYDFHKMASILNLLSKTI